MRASSLTFYSLMSIVPFLALCFGIAKGFGFQKMLEEELFERFADQKEAFASIVQFSNNLLEETQGSVLAGFGLVLLFWSVVKLLGHIESSINKTWGIKTGRKWKRKVSDYVAMMVILPVFFVLSSSFKVFMVRELPGFMGSLPAGSFLSDFILFLFRFFPFLCMWGLLMFLYCFMPLVKVNLWPAVIGSGVAAFVYEALQSGYIFFQLGVAKFGAIYGSFAALPLFLIWLQMSWWIVLYGSELAFSMQNVEIGEYDYLCKKLSLDYKLLLSVFIVQQCAHSFMNKRAPITRMYLHKELDIPLCLINKLTEELVACGILLEIQTRDEYQNGYQLYSYIDSLSLADVQSAISKTGLNEMPQPASGDFEKVKKAMKTLQESVRKLPDNVLIKDI